MEEVSPVAAHLNGNRKTKTTSAMMEERRANSRAWVMVVIMSCMTELRFTGKMMFKLLWDLEDAICFTIDYKCMLPTTIILPQGF